MSCLTCMLSNKSKILVTLRVVIILISVLHLAIGGFGIIGYASKHDTAESGVTALVIGIIALLVGIIGIVAAAKTYIWLIGIFAVIMVILMGLNIATAVALANNWDNLLSQSEIEIRRQGKTTDSPEFQMIRETVSTLFGAVYGVAVAMAVIQAIAFLTSLLLSYIVYVIRNPVDALKRTVGQA